MSKREDELQARVDELESELYKLRLMSTGIPPHLQAVVEQADRDRKDSKAIIEALNRRLEGQQAYMLENGFTLPEEQTDADMRKIAEQMGKPLYEWGKACVVWSRTWVWHAPGKVEMLTIPPAIYPGKLVDAQKEFSGAFLYLLGRIPILADVGNQHIDGLTTDELLLIVRELTPYKYVLGDFIQKRLEAFNQVWTKIEAAKNRKTRHDNKQYFFTVIDRIFKNAESRRKDATTGVQLLSPGIQDKAI